MIAFTALLANAFAAALWQGILLAALVAVCLRLFPGLSAAARSVIWTAVFTALFLLHFVPLLHTDAPASAGPARSSLHLAPVWSLGLAALWLALSLIRATQLLLSVHAFNRVARNAIPAPIQPSPAYILCISPDVDRPSVFGFFRPRVLVPASLFAALAPGDLNQVLLHETEHLRRRDAWTNLLQKLALVLVPLNPALFWIERRLCLERELACDDRVLAQTGAPRAYATCLTTLAEQSVVRRGLSLALGVLGGQVLGRESELSRRVHRVLHAPQQTLGPRPALALTIGFVLALTMGSLKLAHAPQLISFAPAQRPNHTRQSKRFDSESAQAILASYKVIENKPVPLSSASPSRPKPILAAQKLPRRKSRGAEPRLTLRARVAPDQDAPHLILTDATAGQFSYTLVQTVFRVPAYAAVATPNGWIILQL